MGLARQSVQQTADGLEQEGFIVYSENPFHRRSKLMQITPKGRAALDDILQRQAAWANAMAEDLHVEDLRTAIHVLHQVRKNVGQFLDHTPQAAG